MGSVHEHAEHIAHAGHGGGHSNPRLGMYVGITMSALGVLLAFCAAKVGGERTELVQQLVEQSNAHAKYQGQDVKHRVAFLALEQAYASGFAGATPTVNKESIMSMAKTVERYLKESKLAKVWLDAFDARIAAHVHAQEEYEHGQLSAEIGIVVASVALLLHNPIAWYASLGLGAVALGITGKTLAHTTKAVAKAQHLIEETEKEYRETRNKHKTTDYENQLVSKIQAWAEGTTVAH